MALTLLPQAPAVTAKGGKVITTSRAVADYFGKAHKHVLEAVDSLVSAAPECGPNFRLTLEYVPMPRGGSRPERMYEMDRDGFTLLVMGFTGSEALKFKLAYIAEFNRMEAALQPSQAPALDLNDPASLRTALLGYTEKVLALESKVEELAPVAAVAEAHHNMGRLVSLFRFARTLDGVNSMKIKSDLACAGYLHRVGKEYRVRSQYRDWLFVEKRDEVYQSLDIYALPDGEKEIVRLYNDRELTMKVVPGTRRTPRLAA